MKSPICVVLVLVCLVDLSWGYPSGAPSTVCENMTPGHGSQQNSANPYAINLGGITKYEAGVNIPITISGTFQGLLLQARKADGSSTTSYGTFTVNAADYVKATGCSGTNNAVTHSSTDAKTNLMVTWMPPSEDVGALEFVATVAEQKSTWWKNTKSVALTYQAGTGTTTTGGATGSTPTAVTTTTAKTTTTKSTSNGGSSSSVHVASTSSCLLTFMWGAWRMIQHL